MAAVPSGLVLVPAGRFLAPRAPLRGAADVPAAAQPDADAAAPKRRRKVSSAPRGASEGQALGRAGLEPAAPQLARSAAFLARLRCDVADLLAAFAERLSAGAGTAPGEASGLVHIFVAEWRRLGWMHVQFAWGEHAGTRAAFWQSVGDALVQRLAPLQGQLASAASVTDEALIAAVGAVIGLYVLCGTALDVSAAAQRLGPQIDASAGDEAASPQALGSNERPNDAMDEDSGTSAARDDAPALEDDGGVQLWHLEVPADLHATILQLPDAFKRNYRSPAPILVAELSAVVQALRGELAPPRTVTVVGERQMFPSDAMLAAKTYRSNVRPEALLSEAQRRSIQASARRRQRAVQLHKTPEPITPDEEALAAHRAAQVAAAGPPADEEQEAVSFEAPSGAASIFAVTPCAGSAWAHTREAARLGNAADVDRTSAKFGELLFEIPALRSACPSAPGLDDTAHAAVALPSSGSDQLAVPLARAELVRELVRERLERTAPSAPSSALRAERVGARVPLPHKRAFQTASQAGLDGLKAATVPLEASTAQYRAAVERTLEGSGDLAPAQRALRHDVVRTAKERTRRAVDEARQRDGAAGAAPPNGQSGGE